MGSSASSATVNDLLVSAERIEESLSIFLDSEWEIEKERSGREPAKVRAYGSNESEQIVVDVDDADLSLRVAYRGSDYDSDSLLDLGYISEETRLEKVALRELEDEIQRMYRENRAKYMLEK